MPFNEKYDDFFNHIKTVLNGEGFEPVRTDEITFVGNIVDMIRQGLLSSDFSLAEISDARPNVMYEIGLAHAFGKPVIMFTNQENISELPFDIKNERVFLYNDFAEVGEVLKKVLREYKGNSSIL
jgi:nucleoside 2-deoxyribosyltransferase